jgi:hypothetical protein
MNSMEMVNEIIKIWLKSERYELVNDFKNAPSGAATGGEGAAIIGKFLVDLEFKNPDAYFEVREQIKTLLNYLSSRGMHIKPSKKDGL